MARRRWVAWLGASPVLLAALVWGPGPPAGADPLRGPASARLDNPLRPALENQFGETVAFAGDVDGDGDDELLVGASTWEDPRSTGDGGVALYAGSPDGVQPTPVTLEPPPGAVRLGSSLASAGDVDGDGDDEVLIGAYLSVHLYLGSPTGLGTSHALTTPGDAWSDRPVAAGVGDVDGDGYDDVLVGDPDADGEHRREGRVLLHLGSDTGLQPASQLLRGARRPGARFGTAVAPAGDVNGDGYADVLVGAPGWRAPGEPREGRGFVFLGSPDGLQRPGWHVDPANFQHGGHQGFGWELGPAGDVDGDGYDDVVFGLAYPRERVYLYRGSADGPTRPGQVRHEGGPTAYGFGSAVAGVGDLDGDGYDEVVVGAPEANVDAVSEGRVFIYRGTPAGLARRAITRDPANRRWSELGDAVAGGGDLDGDGSPDLVISAPEHRVELYRGRVYVYH